MSKINAALITMLFVWNIYLNLKLWLYGRLHDDLEMSLHIFAYRIGYKKEYEESRAEVVKQ